jgi:hypothetical protein
MHPLGWLIRYFLVALAGGVAADKAMGILFEIGEPLKGLIFRNRVHGDKHCGGDA